MNCSDAKLLCAAGMLAYELWDGRRSLDPSVGSWTEADDFSHQVAAHDAALRLGIGSAMWYRIIARQRQPGETLLHLFERATDDAIGHMTSED